MRRHRIVLSFLFLLFSTTPSSSPAASSPYFTVGWKDGKAWFFTPAQKPFLSMGINAIGDQSYRAPNADYYHPVKNQYGGDKQAWIKTVFTRLKKWHFNTIGSWSDGDLSGRKFPYTAMISIGRGNPWDDVLLSVFTESFAQRLKENAQNAAATRDDPFLVGYFLDNEMPWWGDHGWRSDGQQTLLEKYALSGVDDANKEALKKFFQDRYDKDIEAFDQAWGLHLQSFEEMDSPVTLEVKTKKQKAAAEDWAGVVAERYFSAAAGDLRQVDPHHLVLGVRFAGQAPWPVVEACARHCDVVSVNLYSKTGDVDQALLDNFYAKADKPLLISEYSFSARENQSGDPNTKGADVAVDTQKERVEHYNRYAHRLLELPYIVGLHWFEWADESPEGRFDGENSDYGLVDLHDREYGLLTRAQAKLNLIASSVHKKSDVPLPRAFEEAKGPDYRRAETGVKVALVRPYLKISSGAQLDTWGDSDNGGKAAAKADSGSVILDYETGTGWGCGVSAPPNLGPFTAPGVVDLRGYGFFNFKAFVPMGVTFMVYLDESGTAAPNQARYEGVNGADGESYQFPAMTGTGRWEDYQVDLSELQHRDYWGNQKGNNTLDLQSLSEVSFYLSGGQGAGRMLVKDLEFRVK